MVFSGDRCSETTVSEQHFYLNNIISLARHIRQTALWENVIHPSNTPGNLRQRMGHYPAKKLKKYFTALFL
jgi:hypothetical protein